MNSIPVVRLRLLLTVNQDGVLVWKKRKISLFKGNDLRSRTARMKLWNLRFANKPVCNSVDRQGYRYGDIDGIRLRLHRVVWAFHHGDWPSGEIDHIDGDKLNNRIENLRVVDRVWNNRNLKMQANNTSGCRGVDWCAVAFKWRVRVCSKHIGLFSSYAQACAARNEAMARFGGFSARHGAVK